MTSSVVVIRASVALAAFLAALATVTWRQSRAFEALAELDELRWRSSVARAERVEVERRIQGLESRSRVVGEARRRFGMRMPDAAELVILPKGGAP